MILRGAIAWIGLMVLAIANGALRELLLTPRLGPKIGHLVSTVLLCVLILLMALLLAPWMAAREPSDAWQIGGLWLLLTLAFEFLAGHYAFGNSWQKLLAEYDVLQGRLWVLVPVIALISPRLALAARG